MILVPNVEPLREHNTCHMPAGTPAGGRFCSKDVTVTDNKDFVIDTPAGRVASLMLNPSSDDHFTVGLTRVHSAYRRRGAAKALYLKAVEVAKAEGKKGLRSFVGARSADAERLWASLRKTGRVRRGKLHSKHWVPEGIDVDYLESLREANPCHKPAGTPDGGQFCSADGPAKVLHRGDAGDVHPSLDKADPRALFGPGIYLTDNRRIAGDYTTKGAHDAVLFRYGGSPGKTRKADVISRFIHRTLVARTEWDHMRYLSPGKNALESPLEPGTFVHKDTAKAHADAKAAWDAMADSVEVRVNADGSAVIRKKSAPGRVASYRVPESWLSKTIDAEAEIDDDVLDALHDTLRAHGDRQTARDMYAFATAEDADGNRPTFRAVYTAISGGPLRDSDDAIVDLRRAFKALGYKGIRYAGGTTMGGGGRHNAYVFWDEQGLKKRRVK